MKLLSPLNGSAEVKPLLDAGAEEFYCGLTPPEWQENFRRSWINRRSPDSAGVSDLSDFRRIVASAEGRPVHVTLNAPFYPAGALDFLVRYGATLLDEGASGLIVADLDLLLALAEAGLASWVHLSSLATCTNPCAAAFYRDLGVSRIILPRHLTLNEIEECVIPGMEFETFLLNHGCAFEEGLCATTHAAGAFCLGDGEGVSGVSARTKENYEFWRWTLNHCGCHTSRGYPVGPCGLCALPRMLAAGIGSVKVVGREASLERKQKAVSLAAGALAIARDGRGPEEIREMVIERRGAAAMCEEAHLCYYPDVWEKPLREAEAC